MLRTTLPVAPGGGIATLPGMELRRQRNSAEWIFVVAMVLLCGTLTVLQYRWTGEVARAEMTRLRESLTQQAGLLANTFDAELAKSCAVLVPTADELDKDDRQAVHRTNLRAWKSENPRPIFKHMAVAVPSGDSIKLLEMDATTESLVPMEWPAGWESLRGDLEEKLYGPTPPHDPESGWLREFPVMGDFHPGGPHGPRGSGPRGTGRHDGAGDGAGGPREREWVVLELDPDYLKNKWLPDLVSTYLNPQGKPVYDVTVRENGGFGEVLFTSDPEMPDNGGTTVALPFNTFGSGFLAMRGGPSEPRWTLEVRHRAGSLESVVDASRKRNLAVALVLLALILTSGWMLLRATRHSHNLAEERMRFVANVTHELRTPLTVIRGAAHNLKRGIVKDPGAIGRYSGLILEHAEALGSMVEQVLDFSGGGKGLSDREPVEIAQVLRDAAALVRQDPRFSGCRIDLHLPASLPGVTGDRAALQRAFQNLMENAAKHGAADGRIEVTAAAGARLLRIMVSDQGPGIPAGELKDVFKPFFRGGRARSNQVRGSGLGLSLVKETAEAHGGKISAGSEPGKGSTFTLTLPV